MELDSLLDDMSRLSISSYSLIARDYGGFK